MPSKSENKRRRKRKPKTRSRNRYLKLPVYKVLPFLPISYELKPGRFLIIASTNLQKQTSNSLSNNIKSLKDSKLNEEDVSVATNEKNGVVLTLTDTNNLSKGNINWAYQSDKSISDSDPYCYINENISDHDEKKGQACISATHSIILDISTTSFVDTVAVKTLKNV